MVIASEACPLNKSSHSPKPKICRHASSMWETGTEAGLARKDELLPGPHYLSDSLCRGICPPALYSPSLDPVFAFSRRTRRIRQTQLRRSIGRCNSRLRTRGLGLVRSRPLAGEASASFALRSCSGSELLHSQGESYLCRSRSQSLADCEVCAGTRWSLPAISGDVGNDKAQLHRSRRCWSCSLVRNLHYLRFRFCKGT